MTAPPCPPGAVTPAGPFGLRAAGVPRCASNFGSVSPLVGTCAPMTRCVHTGLSIPECSCRACLHALVQAHAPRPATNAAAMTLPSAEGRDTGAERPRAA